MSNISTPLSESSGCKDHVDRTLAIKPVTTFRKTTEKETRQRSETQKIRKEKYEVNNQRKHKTKIEMKRQQRVAKDTLPKKEPGEYKHEMAQAAVNPERPLDGQQPQPEEQKVEDYNNPSEYTGMRSIEVKTDPYGNVITSPLEQTTSEMQVVFVDLYKPIIDEVEAFCHIISVPMNERNWYKLYKLIRVKVQQIIKSDYSKMEKHLILRHVQYAPGVIRFRRLFEKQAYTHSNPTSFDKPNNVVYKSVGHDWLIPLLSDNPWQQFETVILLSFLWFVVRVFSNDHFILCVAYASFLYWLLFKASLDAKYIAPLGKAALSLSLTNLYYDQYSDNACNIVIFTILYSMFYFKFGRNIPDSRMPFPMVLTRDNVWRRFDEKKDKVTLVDDVRSHLQHPVIETNTTCDKSGEVTINILPLTPNVVLSNKPKPEKERLVGIELNPGPIFHELFWLLVSFVIGIVVEMVGGFTVGYLYTTIYNVPASLTTAFVVDGLRVVTVIQTFIMLDFLYRRTAYMGPLFAIANAVALCYVSFVPQPRLVGIEPNPGPVGRFSNGFDSLEIWSTSVRDKPIAEAVLYTCIYLFGYYCLYFLYIEGARIIERPIWSNCSWYRFTLDLSVHGHQQFLYQPFRVAFYLALYQIVDPFLAFMMFCRELNSFVSYYIILVGVELNPGPTVSAPIIPGDTKEGSVCKDLNAPEKQFREVQVKHFLVSEYEPVVYPNDKQSQLSAIQARVLKKTPEIDQAEMGRFIKFAKKNFKKFFRVGKVDSLSFEDYIKGSNASPSVKTKLKETREYLDACGVTEDSRLSKRTCNKWTIRESFVKVENNIYRSPMGDNQKAARLIQGAKPEFTCLVGPFIAALQADIKQQWNEDSPFFFTSGADQSTVASYLVHEGDIVEDDVSAWDSSISPELCEFELWMAKQFGAKRAVLSLMRANIKTRGYTSHFYYEVDGTRKSGDQYTSLFNSIINGLVHAYIICKHTGWSVDVMKRRVKMVLQGDDDTMVGPGLHKVPFKKEMLKLGFKADAIKRMSLDETEFCSCFHYSHSSTEHYLVPKLGRLLPKLGHSINLPSNVSPDSYRRGIALGLLFTYPKDRLMQAIGNSLLRNSKDVPAYQPKIEQHKMVGQIDCDLEPLYATKYNLSSFDVTCLVNFLNNCVTGDEWPKEYQYLIFDRDTSGPTLIY